MDDKEMLHWAAKGADIDLLEGVTWNPLDDDDDAIPLLLQLLRRGATLDGGPVGLLLSIDEPQVNAMAMAPLDASTWDMAAALRRVTVDALAQLTRALEQPHEVITGEEA